MKEINSVARGRRGTDEGEANALKPSLTLNGTAAPVFFADNLL